MNAPITTGRVVVGVDGSAASIDAVGWASRYVALTGARLEALTTWDVPGAHGFDLGYGFETTQVDWEATACEIQKNALDQALPGDLKGLSAPWCRAIRPRCWSPPPRARICWWSDRGVTAGSLECCWARSAAMS